MNKMYYENQSYAQHSPKSISLTSRIKKKEGGSFISLPEP